MRFATFLLALAFIAGTAVAQKPASRPVKSAKGRKLGLAKPLVFEKDREVYGAPLKGLKHIPLGKVTKKSKTWNGKKVQIRGRITGVCPKKGCWMMVQDGEQTVRVKFTDYSFFVPLDCTKQFATAEGTVTVRVESEAERRHYAEDAGASPEEIAKIKGDKTILSFMADAVQIGKPPAPKKAGKDKKDKKNKKG